MNFYDCCDQKMEAKSTTKDAPHFNAGWRGWAEKVR